MNALEEEEPSRGCPGEMESAYYRGEHLEWMRLQCSQEAGVVLPIVALVGDTCVAMR